MPPLILSARKQLSSASLPSLIPSPALLQICQWHAQDFGPPAECLKALAPFLPEAQGSSLRELIGGSSTNNLVRMLDEGWMAKEGNVILKYSAYDFHCRRLKLI